MKNVIFLDNHDLSRFFLLCGKDINRFKMGVAFLLTTRGISQLYYGTELSMDGDVASHPDIPLDFPGRWSEDEINASTREGRSAAHDEVYDYLTKLLNWRESNSEFMVENLHTTFLRTTSTCISGVI